MTSEDEKIEKWLRERENEKGKEYLRRRRALLIPDIFKKDKLTKAIREFEETARIEDERQARVYEEVMKLLAKKDVLTDDIGAMLEGVRETAKEQHELFKQKIKETVEYVRKLYKQKIEKHAKTLKTKIKEEDKALKELQQAILETRSSQIRYDQACTIYSNTVDELNVLIRKYNKEIRELNNRGL